jgi:subtilisin family serine protease
MPRDFESQVIGPIRTILREMVPGYTRALLTNDSVRASITVTADATLTREFPTARLIPVDLRRKLIRRTLDNLLNVAVQASDSMAGAASVAVESTQLTAAGGDPTSFGLTPDEANAVMAVPPGASVTGILIQPKGNADQEAAREALRQALTSFAQIGEQDLPAAEAWKLENIVGNFLASHEDVVLPASRAFELARRIADHPQIEAAEPALDLPAVLPADAQAAAASGLFGGCPNPATDPVFAASMKDPEWSVKMVKAFEAWAYTDSLISQGDNFRQSRGNGVRIAHLDTGLAPHIEMDRQAGWAGRILWEQSENVYDPQRDPRASDPLDGPWYEAIEVGMITNPGHGTGTVTILGSPEGDSNAQKPPKGWVTGTAPAADILPIRIHVTVAQWNQSHMAKGIALAADKGCQVLTMSMGGPGQLFTDTLHKAVQYAAEKGVVLCTAAGNEVRFVVKPAAFDEVIACAGCNIDRAEWSGSCRGPQVTITGPAQFVWHAIADKKDRQPDTLDANGRHLALSWCGSGTSFATPTIAGLAACWLAHHGGWDAVRTYYGHPRYIPRAFAYLLRTSAYNASPSLDPRNFGPGIVDGVKLLHAALPPTSVLLSWPKKGVDTLPSAIVGAASIAAVPPVQTAEDRTMVTLTSLGIPPIDQKEFLHRFGPEISYLTLYGPLQAANLPAGPSSDSDLAGAASLASGGAASMNQSATAKIVKRFGSAELAHAVK